MTRTALITGATAGIGAGAARAFVAAGWRVIGTGRRADRLQALADELGAAFHPLAFDITDARGVRSFAVTVALLDAAIRLLGDQFQWVSPPYEYETRKPPIDILYGSDRLRRRLDQRRALTAEELIELTACDALAWRRRTAGIHLYD